MLKLVSFLGAIIGPKTAQLLVSLLPVLLIIGAVGWGMRVDHLRRQHLADVKAVGAALRDVGFRGKMPGDYPDAIRWLDRERLRFLKSRNDLRAAIDEQNARIAALEDQRDAYAREAKAAQDRAAAAIDARDRWIAKAEAAAARAEAKTCDQEIREANDALDAIRNSGF